MYIDAHCHLDLYPDPYKIISDIEKNRIITIAVTNLPSHFELLLNNTKQCQFIRPALGLHPLVSSQVTELEKQKFKIYVAKTSYVGEIGLDLSTGNKPTLLLQIENFKYVLNCLRGNNKFVTIHSRKAEEIIIDLLDEYNLSKAVFHWYTGQISSLDKILLKGHYFSINQAMTLNTKGIKIIERIPKDRIITETDGPFVQIGSTSINPTHISLLIKFLGKLWTIPETEVQLQVFNNLKNILGIVK
jgi:TatD DNase family protein